MAERIKFGEFVIFALVLTAFIYPVAGSWEWNGGWLNSVGNVEFIDFAGSSIVHSVGAWAGLVGAMLLGPRIGKYVDGKVQAIPGHNMSIATLGALILWIGWYGFNPGSQLAMDQWVPYVAVTTTLGAAGGAIGATVISTITSKKPDLTMIINGILAGLVSVTAGCGNLTLTGSWVAGLVGGIIVVFSVAALDAAGIDDPVGAFSVHGVCGVWGTLVIGLWGYDIQGDGSGLGLLVGGGIDQLGIQALGCCCLCHLDRGDLLHRLADHRLPLRRHPRHRTGRVRRSGHRRTRHGGLRRFLHHQQLIHLISCCSQARPWPGFFLPADAAGPIESSNTQRPPWTPTPSSAPSTIPSATTGVASGAPRKWPRAWSRPTRAA